MRKLPTFIPLFGTIAVLGVLTAPQPAQAMPTCEQEIRIRCSGYDVQGRPRLDTRHSSYEECVQEETELRCAGSSYTGYSGTMAFRREGAGD